MIDKLIKEKVSARALEIYEWRCANGIAGNETTDWLEAEQDLCDRRKNKNCPVCHYPIFKKDGIMVCCRCDWKVEKKRSADEHLPDMDNIRKNFNG